MEATPISVANFPTPGAPMKQKKSKTRLQRIASDKENDVGCISKQLFAAEEEKEVEIDIDTPKKRLRYGEGPGQDQQPLYTFEKCPLMDFAGRRSTMQTILRRHMGLTDDVIPDLGGKTGQAIMSNLLKATLWAILQRLLCDIIYSECEGCILDRPGQNSHDCLFWEDAVFDEKLKRVCSNLNMEPVLHVLISASCCLDSLSLNQNHILDLSRMLACIANAEHPFKYFRDLYQECDRSYVTMVETYLYKTFHSKNAITVFL